MGDIWDDLLGAWVPESDPWVPAPPSGQVAVPSEPASDPLLDLLSELERAQGGFYVGRPHHMDAEFLARVQAGEDRSDDGGHAVIREAVGNFRAALIAYREARDPESAADLAAALAYRSDLLLDAMGVS